MSVHGEIDLANSGQLEEALLAVENETGGGVVLDLDEVGFIDSSGVRLLILFTERLIERGMELRIACAPNGAVRRILDSTGLGKKLMLHESRDDAVESFGSR